MRYTAFATSLMGMFWSMAASAEVPPPVFYLPLDGSTAAPVAGGSGEPVRRVTGDADPILELVGRQRWRFVAGRVGQAIDCGDQPLVYECAGNFRGDEGTASFWINPDWRGDNKALYSTLFGASDWGMVYKFENQSTLTFGTAKPDRDLYYDCGGGDLRAWRPGDWHHVAVTWSRSQNARRVYVDGQLAGSAPFPFAREVKSGPLFLGAGCTLYPDPVAHAKLDEFALWDKPLDAAAVGALFALGSAGKPLQNLAPDTQRMAGSTFRPTKVRAPTPPAPNDLLTTQSGLRTLVSLNGWWSFLPSPRELDAMPTADWGLSRVPGYWTTPQVNMAPDGTRGGKWPQPLGQCWVAYYQRAFTADLAWQSTHVLLQLGGVDGLAEVYINEQLLGWLGAWEPESYDLSPFLRWGVENTITVVLRTRGGGRQAGVYGDVGLCILAGPLLNDVSVRPRVDTGQIEFSAGVWNPGQAIEGLVEMEVRTTSDPSTVVRQFSSPVRLTAAKEDGAALSSQLQRVTHTFDWPDAHVWTIDDPFLYECTARIRLGGAVVDELPSERFGFRSFTQRGAQFFLNGTPFHLRGHQIDLGWADQMQRVKELKAAGMNSLELSGPISSGWYADTPYQQQLFQDILNYCDENGLVALPNLPDPPVLRDRLFDPAVAALYRQRVEKHIRTYGNHACIVMWYMNFNLAGYYWYVAPSKLDGSYKPDDEPTRSCERFSLEAQRIAQSIDTRPIYHHACGNFGDIFTANLYLGPNSPTQEREEWPSAWAARRPFPFVACEHCCMLIPYWFRPRQFPLSVVYAGEPIFDEIAAMYLGPRVYTQITPELFDLYDVGRTPRGGRTRALIRHHEGYQETKAQVACHSLRAWRTWGVSGIIFNAENWDFKDDDDNALPMMRALGRYFGDTDLYLAGPGNDWPSKDHSFFSGETISKQAVLLNDLTHDLPVELGWTLRDAAGTTYASGRITAVAKAGTPTFYPIECVAPHVSQRTELVLTVEPARSSQNFQAAAFALQIFPPRKAVATANVVLYDPVGDTTKLLQQAGVRFTVLADDTKLTPERLLVVGRRSYDERFLALAQSLALDRAIREGLHVLVFEQTEGKPFGLDLEETSTRQTFIALPGHPALENLQPADVQDLRGQSDLLVPYPDAAPETRTQWPARGFKWGNRGIVATDVYRKPHYSPFRPILECGFDLVQSPLLEAEFGNGRVTLCQMDVTPRYGTDPISTQLVDNLLGTLARPTEQPRVMCSFVGDSARAFVARFGIVPEPFEAGTRGVILVGRELLEAAQVTQLEHCAREGATVLLLPGAANAVGGLQTRAETCFLAGLTDDPLLSGVNAGDLYLKALVTVPCALEQGGWRNLTTPGLLAVRPVGAGRFVACGLDPDALGQTRGRVKSLRFWNLLLINLAVERNALNVSTPTQTYEDNEWERLPPYMNW